MSRPWPRRGVTPRVGPVAGVRPALGLR